MAASRRPILRVWQTMIARMLRPLRFGIVGAFNTVLGLGIILTAKAAFGIGDLAANALGYGIGILASFTLNRAWTFRNQTRILPAFARFVGAFLAAYAINLATVFGMRDGLNVNSYVAQAIGVVPYTLFFYWASAQFVFPHDGAARQVSDKTRDKTPDVATERSR